ncbi:autotransporter outer membrane beta-barrel domain-containing protein [Yersinia enterocolitica]
MENINNSREHMLITSLPKQNELMLKKSPIAKFVASVLFILGGISTNVNADIAPTHEGVVNDKYVKLISSQKAENAVLNAEGPLTLTENAEAFNTLVDSDYMVPIFSLNDESQANTTIISKGTMWVTDNATASKTFVGLTEEENNQQPVSPETTIKMAIFKTGKAKDTTVGMHGRFYIADSGTAEKTYIRKGGELIIGSFYGGTPILSDTTIEGTFELRNDVTLNGSTTFLPGSVLKGNNYDITNDGDMIFKGVGGKIEVYSYMDGSGSLTIDSPGKTLTLQGDQYIYQGQTNIQAGTLKILETDFSSSPIIGKADAELVLSNSTVNTKANGVRMTIDGQSKWYIAGDSSVAALNISENSQIHLNHDQAGNKLTINGDYHSDGGTLIFYSKLEGDDSETDRMLIEGNTSGDTKVIINNLGGEGAQTDLGILLIEVKGQSDGNFKQDGRNVAGAYEYFLRRGSEDNRNKNWYMISDAAIVDKKPMTGKKIEEAIPNVGNEEDKANKPNVNPPTIGKYPDRIVYELLTATLSEILEQKEKEKSASANASQKTAPTTEIENEPKNISVDKSPEVTKDIPPKDINAMAAPTKPEVEIQRSKNAPQKTYKPVYRPENGSYIANLSMARNLFTTDLDNRSGNYKYKDAATGEWRTSSMWIQTQGGIKQFGKTVDQLNIKGKYYSIQLGGDVAKWDIGTQGSGRIGMLAGMGKATNHSKSNITGYYSNGSVNGYNFGVYATWLTDQQNKTGLYIDTLAQYSWFNNAVNGQELAEEKYKSSGFTSSIESGYTFNIGSTEQLSYFIQPNAKITWVGLNAQTHTATNKDIINYTNRGQLITRIGAKTYLQTTNNSEQQFMPFIAVNWLHQNHNTGTQLSGQGVENGSKNSAEFKIGVESKIDQRLHAWANINHQIGNYNTNDTNALVGIKYAF